MTHATNFSKHPATWRLKWITQQRMSRQEGTYSLQVKRPKKPVTLTLSSEEWKQAPNFLKAP